MDGEISNFIKVWILTNIAMCYCYYLATRIPKGMMRLMSVLPIIYLFIILPLSLHSPNLCGPTAFFLVWLGNFKLLLFSFDVGPLSVSPNPPSLFHFLCTSCLPIKIKQNPPSKSPSNTNPSHQITQNPIKPVKVPKNLWGLRALVLALGIRLYDYRSHLHPNIILALYYCHVFVCLETLLALSATSARALFGFELEPQFNKPYLSTSLQDFWGYRWNLMVTNILRLTVYNPVRHICTSILGPRWARLPAIISRLFTFTVSGLMHEVIYYYLTRVSPTWEITWFFVLHGMCMVIEVEVKKVTSNRWRLHPVVSRLLTLVFLAVIAKWLFLTQLLRNGVVKKGFNEYAIVVDFVKARLQGRP